jgi:hypothetical protein
MLGDPHNREMSRYIDHIHRVIRQVIFNYGGPSQFYANFFWPTYDTFLQVVEFTEMTESMHILCELCYLLLYVRLKYFFT